MVYVKMVNIVTLMASLGIIKKRVYTIRKLKCMDKSLKKLGRSVFKFAGVASIGKIFSKPLWEKDIVIIIVHSRFSELFDVFLIIQMLCCATLGSKRAL